MAILELLKWGIHSVGISRKELGGGQKQVAEGGEIEIPKASREVEWGGV